MPEIPVECPLDHCKEVMNVDVPLGASIWRTLDKALVKHNEEKHNARPTH